ncbi:amidohydrolase [Psychroflexus sediminis]|uniref:Omega-amidase YafV n=1 Tax=Psychroflexus sediminis TaxID=470826 RepID=A0A1G7YFX6_9FLAO|nr:amidohydrolase [Psychroflexus sediminis]SDG95237.1 Carbon-nitrogen hydrolase [Psychroflexus sediminis]
MSESLKVTYIQTELTWENPKANKAHFENKLSECPSDTDLIILPEMFTTGFSMNAETHAEEVEEVLGWMKAQSKMYQAAITGSAMIKEHGKYFNRMFFVEPGGNVSKYDKKHLFTLAREHETYTPGNERCVVEYKGWKLCLQVCYDLRFPVWARNKDDYEVLIYVANWPEKRVSAWDILLQARAVENMSYCIGLNIIGTDGNSFPYVGHSSAYDALGKSLSEHDPEKEAIQTITLEKSHLYELRDKLGFLKDKDSFSIG